MSNLLPFCQQKNKRKVIGVKSRNEIRTIISDLLGVCLKKPTNPKEEWQQYIETHALLERTVVLEAPMRRPSMNTTPAQRLVNMEKFYQWVTENGVHFDGLRIAQFPGYDLGLVATRDIAKDEQLFAIPRKLILSEENIPPEFKHAQHTSLTNIKLSYALMLESIKSKSFWKTYIDLLPDKYVTVLYFTVQQMEELRGSNALSQALRQYNAIALQYAFIYNYTHQTDNSNEIEKLFKERFSYDLYRWAVSTVMTRQNMIPAKTESDQAEQPPVQQIAALIPFWDMANHRDGTITSFYKMDNHQMTSSAQTNFKNGEQIFIHYGDRSNADLMIHNGFINPANPKDSVAIKLGLCTSDPLYEKRSHLLESLQIPKNTELLVLPPPMHISPQLLAFVRVFNMNVEQLEHWITSDRAMDLLHIDCALETSLEAKTWQYLQTRLMLLLRVFPMALEEDEARLNEYRKGEIQLGYIESMILEYRILEKRILTAALDYTKQRIKT